MSPVKSLYLFFFRRACSWRRFLRPIFRRPDFFSFGLFRAKESPSIDKIAPFGVLYDPPTSGMRGSTSTWVTSGGTLKHRLGWAVTVGSVIALAGCAEKAEE